MAVGIHANGNSAANFTASHSVSMTISAGTDRYGYAVLVQYGEQVDYLTSATFDGNTKTGDIIKVEVTDGVPAMWYFMPLADSEFDGGSQAAAFNLSAAKNGQCAYIIFDNADQTQSGVTTQSNGLTSSDTSVSTTAITPANDGLVMAVGLVAADETVNAGTGFTKTQIIQAGGVYEGAIFTSDTAGASATPSFNWTTSALAEMYGREVMGPSASNNLSMGGIILNP